MTFEFAPDIIAHFSQDETSGGPSKLKAFTRGAMTTDPTTGHRVMGPRVSIPDIIGNTAPASAADIETDTSGKMREGDIWVFTVRRLQLADEATQATDVIIERLGFFYTLNIGDDWHYAGGNRYVAYLDRGESGV